MNPLVVGYDGSEDAQEAIAVAGRLFPGARAVVVTAWRPLVATLAHYPMSATAPLPSESVEIDRNFQTSAENSAAEGADRARSAGLDAEPGAFQTGGPFWEALVEAADQHDAAAIVVGSRGLGGVKSVLLGSVSRGVVHNAGRPVLVVPGASS